MTPTANAVERKLVSKGGIEIPPRKMKAVKELEDLIKKYSVITIVDISNIGSRQMTAIRKILRDQAVILVAKNTLFHIALAKTAKKKPGIEKLTPYVTGNLAFLFTDMDPFKLGLFLAKNRSNAPARIGQLAPKDIVVPAGNTGFQPGPVITQLQNVGIKTKIVDGTIHIPADTVIASTGDEISLNMVLVLSRLKIEPMEIALELKVAYQDGIILPGEIIKIDVDLVYNQLQQAAMHSFNLAMEIGHITKETLPPLLVKAYRQAMSLAIESSIITEETLPVLLAKANAQASALGDSVKIINPKAAPGGSSENISDTINPPEEKTETPEEPKDNPPE